MKFTISRDALLKPLNLVAGVVERRQTLPILANVLLVLEGDQLALTGTDLEVELVGRVKLAKPGDSGEVTVPARKLVDICKSLPEGADIDFTAQDSKVTVKSGRSRFTLATLPAREFPNVEDSMGTHQFTVKQGQLKRLIDRTGFAMAQQDVRYYLNGMLWEIKANQMRVVATDGHRLALCTLPGKVEAGDDTQVILPRKGVLELQRILGNEDQLLEVSIGSNHLRVQIGEIRFTSKLIDGRFPEYSRVIPATPPKTTVRIQQARTIISRNDSPDVPFRQSMNPYRGCEHGCIYCYARPTHSYLNLSPGLDFETRILAKGNLAQVLARELQARNYVPSQIVIGSATDAYQPAERQWRITRSIIELLARCDHPLAIVTKGSGVERDIVTHRGPARWRGLGLFHRIEGTPHLANPQDRRRQARGERRRRPQDRPEGASRNR